MNFVLNVKFPPLQILEIFLVHFSYSVRDCVPETMFPRFPEFRNFSPFPKCIFLNNFFFWAHCPDFRRNGRKTFLCYVLGVVSNVSVSSDSPPSLLKASYIFSGASGERYGSVVLECCEAEIPAAVSRRTTSSATIDSVSHEKKSVSHDDSKPKQLCQGSL